MKKILLICLACVLVFSLCACNSSDDFDEKLQASLDKVKEEREATAEETTEEVTEETTEEDETVIVDNEYCTFTIKGIDPDGFWGTEVKVYCENKTDSTLMFAWNDTSINGYMMNDLMCAEEVKAGKRSNAEFPFLEKEFEDNGIETIEEIEFNLRVYDSEDYEKDPYVDDTFVYEP